MTTVTITGWSPVDKVVSFTGPNGASYSRRLLDATDPQIVEGLKTGDRVDVTRTEAVTVSAQTSTIAPDDLRHRLTASVLFGWDNQFSGNMIQEANGQTTTGAPIHLNETSFDDVYGRMGMFKVGAGYRTSPRSEVVLSFVYSRSSAEKAFIGTAGPANSALYVNFDRLYVLGLGAGQRFFFARVRFTPYVGYLIGANRFGDIRGTFDGVPLEATPGLAAQDGKFFEKSWALSVGPPGGCCSALVRSSSSPRRSCVTWAACRTWTGSSKKAFAISTARARAGRSRCCSARASGSDRRLRMI